MTGVAGLLALLGYTLVILAMAAMMLNTVIAAALQFFTQARPANARTARKAAWLATAAGAAQVMAIGLNLIIRLVYPDIPEMTRALLAIILTLMTFLAWVTIRDPQAHAPA